MIHEQEHHVLRDFDEQQYTQTLQRYSSAATSRSITMGVAYDLTAAMPSDADILKRSLATPHFLSTITTVQQLTTLRRTASNMDFVDKVPQFTQEVLQGITYLAQDDPEVYLLPAYKVAKNFVTMANPELSALGSKIFASNLRALLLREDLDTEELRSVIKHVISTADTDEIVDIVRQALDPGSPLLQRFPKPIDSVLNLQLLGLNSQERPQRLVAILNEITQGKAEQLLNAWDDSEGKQKDRNKGSEGVYLDNFAVICQLEKTRPGITQLLIEQYGILSFARYPVDVLIEQYDTRNEKDAPYGALVAARHDHNGAVLFMKDQIRALFLQGKELGLKLKLHEAEQIGDITRVVSGSADRHGLLSYLILIAHGDPESMTLGSQDTDQGDIYIDDPDIIPALRVIKNALVPDGHLGLISCWVGIENGLAQSISEEVPNIDVHGADYKAFLRENGIGLTLKDDNLDLRLRFGLQEGNFYTQEDVEYSLRSGNNGEISMRTLAYTEYDVPTRVYRDGKLVRDYTA